VKARDKKRLKNTFLLFGLIGGIATLSAFLLLLWYDHYVTMLGQPLEWVIVYEPNVYIRMFEIVTLTVCLIPLGVLIASYVKKVVKGE